VTNPHVPIIRACAEDAAWVADLIGEAFHPLAVAGWLVPDPQERAQVLPANFRIFVDHALAHGQVQITGDGAAVAVWFPRETELPEPVAYQRRVAAACGGAAPRFLHLDELFDKHHPTAPHHHLAFLAVRPGRQREGLGSALLRHYHDRLDAAGVPTYLEATSQPARDLYARHGYEVMGGPFCLPDATPLWPMWRPAAGVSSR
jgi:GNAT superfamily N-acetyltransferase